MSTGDSDDAGPRPPGEPLELELGNPARPTGSLAFAVERLLSLGPGQSIQLCVMFGAIVIAYSYSLSHACCKVPRCRPHWHTSVWSP